LFRFAKVYGSDSKLDQALDELQQDAFALTRDECAALVPKQAAAAENCTGEATQLVRLAHVVCMTGNFKLAKRLFARLQKPDADAAVSVARSAIMQTPPIAAQTEAACIAEMHQAISAHDFAAAFKVWLGREALVRSTKAAARQLVTIQLDGFGLTKDERSELQMHQMGDAKAVTGQDAVELILLSQEVALTGNQTLARAIDARVREVATKADWDTARTAIENLEERAVATSVSAVVGTGNDFRSARLLVVLANHAAKLAKFHEAVWTFNFDEASKMYDWLVVSRAALFRFAKVYGSDSKLDQALDELQQDAFALTRDE
jgi:hypothetical protein